MDAAAPLAHAVDLGLQRLEAAAAQGLQHDLGEGQDALAADAGEDDAVDAGGAHGRASPAQPSTVQLSEPAEPACCRRTFASRSWSFSTPRRRDWMHSRRKITTEGPGCRRAASMAFTLASCCLGSGASS